MSQTLEPDRQAQQAGTSDQHAFQFTRREVLPRLATLGAGAVVFGPADAPPSSGQSSPPEPPPAAPAVDVLGVVVVNAGHSLGGFISQAWLAAEVALQEPNLSPEVRRRLEGVQRATPGAYRAVGCIREAAGTAK